MFLLDFGLILIVVVLYLGFRERGQGKNAQQSIVLLETSDFFPVRIDHIQTVLEQLKLNEGGERLSVLLFYIKQHLLDMQTSISQINMSLSKTLINQTINAFFIGNLIITFYKIDSR